MEIEKNIQKSTIVKLPIEKFDGKIRYIYDKRSALIALEELNNYSVLGIDTEARPSFVKGRSYPTCLVQIANEDECFLFKINEFGFLPQLKDLLSNPNILKVGLAIKGDFRRLKSQGQFSPANYIDLQDYVKEFGIEAMSLQKIYAIIFQKHISKAQRTSNWENFVYTRKQMEYAALDAWACLQIYNRLEQIRLGA